MWQTDTSIRELLLYSRVDRSRKRPHEHEDPCSILWYNIILWIIIWCSIVWSIRFMSQAQYKADSRNMPCRFLVFMWSFWPRIQEIRETKTISTGARIG